MRTRFWSLCLVLLLALLAVPGLHAQEDEDDSAPATGNTAQLGIVDVVLTTVARNVGLYPAPTRGQLDSSTYPFSGIVGYEFDTLDLRTAPLDCDTPIIPRDQNLVGNVGYQVEVTVVDREYTYRSNAAATTLIHCDQGVEVDVNFGSLPGYGTTISGDAATQLVVNDLNGYLGLDMTVEEINAETLDYRVGYTWNARIFTNSALNCTGNAGDYVDGHTLGYNIDFRVRGIYYNYRVSADGSRIILCRFGRQITDRGTPVQGTATTDAEGNIVADAEAQVAPGSPNTVVLLSQENSLPGTDIVDYMIGLLNQSLGLNMSRAAIDSFALDYPVEYSYQPYFFWDSSLDCATEDGTYEAGDIFGYIVTFEIDGGFWEFHVRGDATDYVDCTTGVPATLPGTEGLALSGTDGTGTDGTTTAATTTIDNAAAIDPLLREMVQFINTDQGLSMTLEGIDALQYPAEYTWTPSTFADTSLGCPEPNVTYTQGEIPGFIVNFVVRGTSYEFRARADGLGLVLCGEDGTPV